jgi:hypothetical protein
VVVRVRANAAPLHRSLARSLPPSLPPSLRALRALPVLPPRPHRPTSFLALEASLRRHGLSALSLRFAQLSCSGSGGEGGDADEPQTQTAMVAAVPPEPLQVKVVEDEDEEEEKGRRGADAEVERLKDEMRAAITKLASVAASLEQVPRPACRVAGWLAPLAARIMLRQGFQPVAGPWLVLVRCGGSAA